MVGNGSISKRTLRAMDAAVRNLDAGVVGEEFDLSEAQDLLEKAAHPPLTPPEGSPPAGAKRRQ